MTLPTPLKGHFIFGRLVLAAVNLPTKFQLSRFRHSRERSGSRILKSASAYPDHVPWRDTLSFVGLYLPRRTYVPNLKCLSSFIPEIGWLPIFLNSGSWPVCFTSASNYLPYVSIILVAVFSLSGDGGTDRREILHDGTWRSRTEIFFPFCGGTPRGP